MTNDREAEPVQEKRLHLIDVLALQVGCYISDLRNIELLPEVKQAISAMPEAAFPLQDWIQLYTYLIQNVCHVHDSAAIKAILLTRISFHTADPCSGDR